MFGQYSTVQARLKKQGTKIEPSVLYAPNRMRSGITCIVKVARALSMDHLRRRSKTIPREDGYIYP